jgi:predicted RNA-binding Zn-ribbon protein involved in translation (DUF1610 family)
VRDTRSVATADAVSADAVSADAAALEAAVVDAAVVDAAALEAASACPSCGVALGAEAWACPECGTAVIAPTGLRPRGRARCRRPADGMPVRWSANRVDGRVLFIVSAVMVALGVVAFVLAKLLGA